MTTRIPLPTRLMPSTTAVVPACCIDQANRIRPARPAVVSIERPKPPFVMRLIKWIPALRRIPARVIGLGDRKGSLAQGKRGFGALIRSQLGATVTATAVNEVFTP